MNVEEFFQILSYGELNNLSIGEQTAGEIIEADQPKILSHMNKGLAALYSRFTHKTDYVQCQLSADRKRYQIHPKHNVSDTEVANTATRFILDSVEEPFLGDVVKILSAVCQDDLTTAFIDETREVRINDRGDALGIEMLSFDTIYVATPVEGAVLTLRYQAKHVPLDLTVDLTAEVILAPILFEALEAFVASRVYSSMNGEENVGKGMALNARYEQICSIVTANDLLQQSGTDSRDKFSVGGWK